MTINRSDPFRGSRLKIQRANEHIDELVGVINAFLESDFYVFAVDPDAQTGRYVVKLSVTSEPPETISLIVGDVLHNLRTAIDFSAAAVARSPGSPRSKYVKFPIRPTRQELEATIQGGDIKVASETVIKTIIEEIKPYRGGNDALYALHELDITDKHHLLIAVLSFSAVSNVSFTCGGTTVLDFTLGILGGTGDFRAIDLPAEGPVNFIGKPKPVFDVLFGEGELFGGQRIVPTLHNLSEMTTGIVNAMEKAFIAGR